MKTRILIVAAAIAALAAPAAASATAPRHQTQRAQIARLTKLNHQLQKRLHNMTVLRDQAKAALATANGQIRSLQSQNATLQDSLQQRTSERTAALAQVASLKAQIAAVPTPLAVAVEQVRREVAYAEWYGGGVPYAHGRLVAQSAMDYVLGHVSATAYGYLEIFGGGQLPTDHADSVLATQDGVCGHAALTFAAIVKRFGLAVRSVQFYYEDPGNIPDSHIAVEVFYDGGWHFYDPTFGLFWTDASGNVLSIADVRNGLGTQQKDTLAFTNLVEDTYYGDTSAFETDPATVVTIDQQPFTD
jgi:transglutaminase-like putative cysteine protease